MNDNLSRAERVARQMASEMQGKLDAGLTPADMGWPHLTTEQLVASEYRCWLNEEMENDWQNGGR